MPVAQRTNTADADLRGIAFQIGVESGRPLTADKVVDGLIDCCDQLANSSAVSRLGTAAPELGTDVRLFSYQRWVIVFRYVEEGVLVLRILDGSQDYLAWKFG